MLRLLLVILIPEEQGRFIPRRHILGEIVMAQKTDYSMANYSIFRKLDRVCIWFIYRLELGKIEKLKWEKDLSLATPWLWYHFYTASSYVHLSLHIPHGMQGA